MKNDINKLHNNPRQSNIELLRIVAMLFIVIHHLCIYGIKNYTVTVEAVDTISIIGVNVFLLISGYFSINLRWKSIFNLLLLCLFYNILHLLIDVYCFNIAHSKSDIIKAFMPLSHPGGWFMNVYFCLMLVSPLLNIGFKQFTKQQDTLFFTCFSVVNLYLGFLLHNDVNSSGYNLVQFIYVYYLGHLVRKYSYFLVKINTNIFILIWLFSSLTTFILSFLGPSSWNYHSYNSPFVLISSISVFCCFLRINMGYVKIVNEVAKSMLAVYLFTNRGGISILIYKFCNLICRFEHDGMVVLSLAGLFCTPISEFLQKSVIRIISK